MNHLLLLPMALCLLVGFMVAATFLVRFWTFPKVFYPTTVSLLRDKMVADKNGRYLYRQYSIWCSVTESRYTPDDYFLCSLVGAGLGFIVGLVAGNVVVSLSLFFLFLLLPTLVLYARYTMKVNRMIASFSRFVDLFARHYSSHKSIVIAFREMMEECPKELQSELILLNNKLTDGGSSIKAMEEFAERLNHDWAHDFATYIISGFEGETKDIQSALNRLTNEMFIQQDEKEERNSEIHSIWISLLIVIFICVLLIPYNHLLLKDAYRLYFFTADGQALLSLAVTVWCLSILLAFIWGRRNR
ncbi:type II secretion system F family protein [Brevibacillus sp. B_LB10_24]|uniref:type II secretion system F family protein n=1 Tax=Brevibacillus sp. B_LB10_24 TaxID=3380645 RepID=UPI0038BB5BF1